MPVSDHVLESLNVDLAKEHAAILQYLIHAVQIHQSGMAEEIERISREEMWHLEWLAEAIRERGGTPTLQRADIERSGEPVRDLGSDVNAELGAIEHYQYTLSQIGDSDPELRRLIERIMDDERYHQQQFEQLVAAASEREDALLAQPKTTREDASAVAPGIALEYTGLLRYLFNKYECGDCEQGEKYFELAINEMRHLHWLAEEAIPSLPVGPLPNVESRVPHVHDASEAWRKAEEYEAIARQTYRDEADTVREHDMRRILGRVLTQHDYHEFELQQMRETERIG